MFSRPQTPPPDRQFLLQWIERDVLASEASEKAKTVVAELRTRLPELQKLLETPQTPPYHAEGPTVESHLVRILSVLFFLNAQTPPHGLQHLEEFAREKTLEEEWSALWGTLKSQEAFLAAYAVAHDLGKGETFRRDSTGRVHYPGHDRIGASPAYAFARNAILQYFGIGSSRAKLLMELIRLHMDILVTFRTAPNGTECKAFAALARRAGLNQELFLDLVPACLFLDTVVGSLHEEGGVRSHDLTPVINWFRAEKDALPERHEARMSATRKAEKLRVKKAYKDAGLSPEEVFELLLTPVGPTRGEIMKKIDELVRNPEAKVDFGEHTEEIRQRARNVMRP